MDDAGSTCLGAVPRAIAAASRGARRDDRRSALRLPIVVALSSIACTASAELRLDNATRHELDNGMTVLLLEDRNFPVVSVQMLYEVGARNEVTGKTGLAHFLEHMAFRETANFPDTDVVSRIYAAGGEWHGYTWIDQTTYYSTVPRNELGLLLRIEADRMQRLALPESDMRAERGAVLAELHMYENYPTSVLIDALMQTVFLAHPYRNNTIGLESDLLALDHSDIVDFYRAHYHPANAVLAVVGDFETDEVLARIESLFGDFPKRDATPPPHTIEPRQAGVRRIAVAGAADDRRLMIAYRAPRASHSDFPVFLVVQELLGGGSGMSFLQNDWGTPARPGSLLYGAAGDVTTWLPPSAQDYAFVIGAVLGAGESAGDVEQRMLGRIERLRDEPVTMEAVDRAIEAVLDELVFDIQTTEDAAHQLAFFEGLGSYRMLRIAGSLVGRVRPGDVRRVAREWLHPEARTVATYRQAVSEPEPGQAPATFIETPAHIPPIDEEPVPTTEVRQLAGGVPVIVQPSDLSSSVFLKVVVPGAPLPGDPFTEDDPEPGYSAWNRLVRPEQLGEAIRDARRAFGKAERVAETPAGLSTDPETRLHQELRAAVAPGLDSRAPAAGPVLIAIAGDIEPGIAVAQLDAAFGDLEPGIAAFSGPLEPSGKRIVSLDLPIAQAQVGYIVAAPAPTDPDYAAWRLLLYILSHDYEGRLGKEAISRQGLAYYIDARYSSPGGPGWITLATGVDPGKVNAFTYQLEAELARLETEPPTDNEVAEAKSHLLGRAISAAQSNEELADRLARHWLWYKELPTIEALEQRLDATDRGDVLRIVSAFTDGMTISVEP